MIKATDIYGRTAGSEQPASQAASGGGSVPFTGVGAVTTWLTVLAILIVLRVLYEVSA